MITIYASELAACIGMNKYQSPVDIARKVWARYDPISYRKSTLRNQASEPPSVENVIDELDLKERTVSLVERIDQVNVENHFQTEEEALKAKNVTLLDLRSHIFTERGKRLEDSSLNRLEEKLNIRVNQRNSKFFKKQMEFKKDDDRIYRYILGGKADGITEDGELVEVKNRQYRIYQDLPVYEKVQIHAYMFLTGIVRCRFVQSFKHEDTEHLEEFDDEFWEEIKSRAGQFVVKMEELVKGDEENQDKFFQLSQF